MKALSATIKKIRNKIKGSIYGFMVGDVLGLPIAGLRAQEVKQTTGKLTHYISNFRHPFFYFLKKGQYGSNTRLMLATLESLAKNRKYNKRALTKSLKTIAKKSKNDYFYSRWLGETVIRSLLSGKPSSSYSCTCVFRCIPMAAFVPNLKKALEIAQDQTKITHLSETSLSGSVFVTYVIHELIYSKRSPEEIVAEAYNLIRKKYLDNQKFVSALELVIGKKIKNIGDARRLLGTGSLTYQTIPLATYIFLKYKNDFEKAVTLGANSYRQDSAQEKNKLAYLSYIGELLESRGGATDGIAGIAAAFTGAYRGYDVIPDKFIVDLEDNDKIGRCIEEGIIFLSLDAQG